MMPSSGAMNLAFILLDAFGVTLRRFILTGEPPITIQCPHRLPRWSYKLKVRLLDEGKRLGVTLQDFNARFSTRQIDRIE